MDICFPLFQQSTNVLLERCSVDRIENQQSRQLLDSTSDIDLTILNGRTNGDSEGIYTYIGIYSIKRR
jgi:hypothetical protein